MRTTPQSRKAPVSSAHSNRPEAKNRERILDAAEDAFGEAGYDAASLRSIAAAAGVEVGLIGYHFRSKDGLYEATLRRRAEELNAARLASLDDARRAANGAAPSLEAIVAAYIRPIFEPAQSPGSRMRSYGRLLAREASRAPIVQLMATLMEPSTRHFISALRQARPDLSVEDISWGFSFMKSTMLDALAENGRVDLISADACDSSDLQAAYARMVPFLAGGFARLSPADP